MAITNVALIMERIKSADISSPIAVFRLPEPEVNGDDVVPAKGKLESVFGATLETRKHIAENPRFVGNFSKHMDLHKVERILYDAVGLFWLSTAHNLQRLLPCDVPGIWPHIEFDLYRVCAARQHDRRIAYAASPELHCFFCLDLPGLTQRESG